MPVYNYREAGANAVQELGLCLAHGVACVEELISRGMAVDDFAPRISFFLNSHNDFFEEIAKFRAARRLWCEIMTERFGEGPTLKKVSFPCSDGGFGADGSATAQQHYSRSVSRLGGSPGGAESVHIDGYDEALCTPTGFGAHCASH